MVGKASKRRRAKARAEKYRASLRELTAEEVTFSITAEQEDIPVRGNALASGDDAADEAYEDEIIARLNDGDVWAWAQVTVTASWQGFKGVAYLGACSYESEADFCRPGGYFDDLKAEALRDLNDTIGATGQKLENLRKGGA